MELLIMVKYLYIISYDHVIDHFSTITSLIMAKSG